jgi:hypothetical protein
MESSQQIKYFPVCGCKRYAFLFGQCLGKFCYPSTRIDEEASIIAQQLQFGGIYRHQIQLTC